MKLFNRILRNFIEFVTPENYARTRGNAEKGDIKDALILMANLFRPWYQSQFKDATADATLNRIPNFAQAVFGGLDTFRAFIFDVSGQFTVQIPTVNQKFDISLESNAKPGFSRLFDADKNKPSHSYQTQLFPITCENDFNEDQASLIFMVDQDEYHQLQVSRPTTPSPARPLCTGGRRTSTALRRSLSHAPPGSMDLKRGPWCRREADLHVPGARAAG